MNVELKMMWLLELLSLVKYFVCLLDRNKKFVKSTKIEIFSFVLLILHYYRAEITLKKKAGDNFKNNGMVCRE
jgi:hypothetical protein